MRRYGLSDAQWELIRGLLPENRPKGGRPWRSHRQVLNGIFWVLHTGAQWREVPERYGPWKTLYNRFARWRDDGTFDRILARLQLKLDEQGRIDWDLWCIDGSSVRASRAAAGARKKGGMRPSRPTTPWAAPAVAMGPNCTWSLTARAFR
jgi:transposase